MPNVSLLKESCGSIFLIEEYVSLYISPAICSKMNVIAWLKFEHTYYDIAV